MSEVTLNAAQTGLILSGDIRFDNVLRLRRHGNQLIDALMNANIEIDLANVVSSDASGLSLLLRWLQYAEKQNKQVRYQSIPASLLKVAKVCGVAKLLGEQYG